MEPIMNIENFFNISLPSGCLTYGVASDTVKVRAYTGKEEFYLSEITPNNLDVKFLQVMRNVVQGIDPGLMTLGDRLYLMVWECAKSYATVIKVKTVCTHCLTDIEVPVDLTNLEVKTLPADFKQPYTVKLSSGDVNLRLLTVNDEIEAAKYEEQHGDGVIYRCAKSMVADINILERMEKLHSMPAVDIATIRAFHEKFSHGPILEDYKFVCPKCKGEGVTSVPFRFDIILYPSGEALVSTFGKGI
jgi:hypothetical protein